MGINFPAAPIIGELYPTPAIAGIPQYKWDGTAWLAMTPSALTYVQRGGDTMTGHLALPTSPAAANAVRRDFVEAYAAPFDAMAYSGMQHNGSMEVSQENGTTPVSVVNAASKYVLDGWLGQISGPGTLSFFKHATYTPLGYPASLVMNVTVANAAPAAGNYAVLTHAIEGYRMSRLLFGTASAKSVTIAFWVNASRTGLLSGALLNGAANRSCTFTYTVNAANVWEYKTVTIPGDVTGTWAKDHTAGVFLSFAMMAGSTVCTAPGVWTAGLFWGVSGTVNCCATTSDNFAISGLVVLPGSQAPTAAQSPMIMRPYDQELATCQRYFNKFLGMSVSGFHSSGGSWIFTMYPLVPTMRGLPTLTYADISYNNASALTNSALAPNIAQFRATTTAPGSAAASFTMSYDARL
jgi:hypothetical protein